MKFVKIVFIIVVILIAAQSCKQEKQNSIEVIPQDTMSMVLADIHIADATLNIIMNSEKFKEIDDYYFSVLKKYSITRSRFDSSIVFYSKKPEVYSDIYENVMSIISRKEGGILALADDKKNLTKNEFNTIANIKTNFDTKQSQNFLLDKKNNINSFSGKYSLLFKPTTKTSNKLEYNLDNTQEISVLMSFMLKIESLEKNKFPLLIIEVLEKDNRVLFEKIDIQKFITTEGEWNKIKINNKYKIKKFVRSGILRVYISNAFNQEFFIDDLFLEIKKKW